MLSPGSVGSRTGVGSGADCSGLWSGLCGLPDWSIFNWLRNYWSRLHWLWNDWGGLFKTDLHGCDRSSRQHNILQNKCMRGLQTKGSSPPGMGPPTLRLQGQEVVGSPTSLITCSDINTGLSRLDRTDSNLTWTDLTDTGTEVDWETSLWETFSSIISEDLVDSGMTEGSSTDSEAGAGTELLSGPGAGTEDSLADATTRATLFLLFLHFSLGVRRWSWTWLGGRRAWWSTQT